MVEIKNYSPFEFQKDNVEIGVKLLDENGGLCIFDETGLGKTISSTMVVLNSVEDQSNINLLVISPISNITTWKNVLSNTSIKYEIVNIEKMKPGHDYTHFIIDEAHNFRTLTSSKYQALYKQIHSQNKRPDVVLASATPFNNTYSELKYILALIPFKSNSYPFINLGVILSQIETCENEIEKLVKNKRNAQLFSVRLKKDKMEWALTRELKRLRECLSYFCIRNTRDKIKEKYPMDIDRMGAVPTKVYNPDIELGGSIGAFFAEIIDKISKAPQVRQNVEFYSEFFKDPKSYTPLFYNILGKRMDSSHYAFHKTLERNIEELIELNEYFKSKNSNNPLLQYGSNKIEVSGRFWKDLQEDLKIFGEAHQMSLAYMETDDYHEKAAKLLDIVDAHDGKLVIFTEYADTMDYLSRYIKNNCKHKYIEFNSKINSKQIDNIILDFDANVDGSKQTDKYKFVLATDVLSEGISMHRANLIVHYDCHWNPARLTQRNGRIDRIIIGNMNPKNVYINNFATDKFIEQCIGIEDKILTKSLKADEVLSFETNREFKRSNFFKDTKGALVSDMNKTVVILHTSQRDIPLIQNNHQAVGTFNDILNTVSDNVLDELDSIKFYDLHRFNYVNGDINNSEIGSKYDEFINLRNFLDKRDIFHAIRNTYADNKFLYLSNRLYSDMAYKVLNEKSEANISERIDNVKKFSYDFTGINSSTLFINKTGSIYSNILPFIK